MNQNYTLADVFMNLFQKAYHPNIFEMSFSELQILNFFKCKYIFGAIYFSDNTVYLIVPTTQ